MAWYDSNWNKRRQITIDKDDIDSDITDFPVYVDIGSIANISDPEAVRVTKADGSTEVPREIFNTNELYYNSEGTISSSSDTDFYIYYDNSNASGYSNTATYGRNAVWDAYHAVYHMADPTTLVDSTGNGHSASNNNGAAAVAALIQNGLDFERANNDYVDTDQHGSLYSNIGNNNNFTISLSANFDDFNGSDRHHVFGNDESGNDSRLLVMVEGDGSVLFQLRDTSRNVIGATSDDLVPNTSEFHHIVATKDGSSASNLNFVINGSPSTSTANQDDGLNSLNNADQAIAIGAYRRGGGSEQDYANAIYDEMRIIEDALSDAWAKAEYINTHSPSSFYTVASEETYSGDMTVLANTIILGSSAVSVSVTTDPLQTFTYEAVSSLPTDNSDLANTYTDAQRDDVDSSDDVRFTLTATGGDYAVHQYKDRYTTDNATAETDIELQSSSAPSSNTVYLEVYNHNTGAWEQADSNSSAAADTDFTLSGSVSGSDYFDAEYVVTWRVYQQA